MATVQAPMSTQARSPRTSASLSGMAYTRPWRSSPLAGPVFSTLPPIISESSEELESQEHDLSALESLHDFGQSRSPSSSSIVSHASASASGYGSRNTSSASALLLFEGEASTSSISLPPSTSAHGTGTSSSHGHASPSRPARLSKSLSRRPSSAHYDAPPRNVGEVSITPLPRARTTSHSYSRPASYAGPSLILSPTMPAAYTRTSPLSQLNTAKQSPSVSRDPSANWMSSSPFGPAVTPKFSRLAMASPAVVMPLSAREYRKRKASEVQGRSKENDSPSSSNHPAVIDNPMSALRGPNGLPLVKVSPPPADDAHKSRSPPSSITRHGPPRPPLQPHADPSPVPFPHPPLSSQPQARHSIRRSRSRPNTPPRSSPLASRPPISPKSSTGTFFSLASVPDGDTPSFSPNASDAPPSMLTRADSLNMLNAGLPPRPRPRLRRKSYPDRISSGARLSLVEAMNRLSQENSSLHRLSGISQTDGANRLSVLSQASGHTLFYDIESEDGHVNVGRARSGSGSPHSTALHTQSLEDLSSTLVRTGIEVVHPNRDRMNGAIDDVRTGKRNVRMVRISDTVEVSPPPVPRRRKLTKSRPGSVRASVVKEVKSEGQPLERRASLLPWKSKGSGDSKGIVVSVAEKIDGGDGTSSLATKSILHSQETTAVTSSLAPTANGSSHVEPRSKPKSDNARIKKPMPTVTSPLLASSPRKAHRYTFSFLPSPTFYRSRRDKPNTLPAVVDLGLDSDTHNRSKGGGVDGASTSIRTMTQGSESTLTPASHAVNDLATPGSSRRLSGRGADLSAVPMLRRLNAQEMELAITDAPLPNPWDAHGGSTPSLVTNGSTATTLSVPRTPSFVRVAGGGGEPFIPRPSGLKESFTDTYGDDSGGVRAGGKTLRSRIHQKPDPSPLARGGGGLETSGEDEGTCVCARPSSGLLNHSPQLGSRPGTPNSMLTTATETSASYASFSTTPTTAASSTSTSRSTSPSAPLSLMMREKWDRRLSTPHIEDGNGGGDACALCGHVVSRSTSPASLTDGPMHPMFTVPLLTVPASTISYPRSTPVTSGHARLADGGGSKAGRKNEQRLNAPVPVPGAISVNAKNDHERVILTGHKTKAISTADVMTASPSRAKKSRRPQTAPASMGDAALKFMEETQAKHLEISGDRLTKPQGGGSRFKAMLKGLLKWGV